MLFQCFKKNNNQNHKTRHLLFSTFKLIHKSSKKKKGRGSTSQWQKHAEQLWVRQLYRVSYIMTVTLENLLWQNLLCKLEEQLSLSVSVGFHLYSTHPGRAGRREHIAHVLHEYIACDPKAISGRMQKGLPNSLGQNFNSSGGAKDTE